MVDDERLRQKIDVIRSFLERELSGFEVRQYEQFDFDAYVFRLSRGSAGESLGLVVSREFIADHTEQEIADHLVSESVTRRIEASAGKDLFMENAGFRVVDRGWEKEQTREPKRTSRKQASTPSKKTTTGHPFMDALSQRQLEPGSELPNLMWTGKVLERKRKLQGDDLESIVISPISLLIAASRHDRRVRQAIEASGTKQDHLMKTAGIPAGGVEHGTTREALVNDYVLTGLSAYQGSFPNRPVVDGRGIAWACLASKDPECFNAVAEAGGDIASIQNALKPQLNHPPGSSEATPNFPESEKANPIEREDQPTDDPAPPEEELFVNEGQGNASYEVVPPRAERLRVGDRLGAFNDEVDGIDRLNYTDYVEILAELAGSKHVHPPLTIGIFGRWGTGKTFILNKIKARLEERASADDSMTVGTLWFNAWQYAASNDVWIALLRRTIDCCEKLAFSNPVRRFYERLGRNLKRLWRRSPLLLVMLLLLFAVTPGVLSWRFFEQGWAGVGTSIVFLGGMAAMLSHPITKKLVSWIGPKERSWESEDLVEIKRELEALDKHLKERHTRLAVFIDDLDRCEPDKAVQVLQVLKLLIDFESIVVFLGVDSTVLAGAIEDHYGDSLVRSGATGYDYIEKIVQIPFRIPEPSTDDMRAFLTGIMQPSNGTLERDAANRTASEDGGGEAATIGDDHSDVSASAVSSPPPNEEGLIPPVEEPTTFSTDEALALASIAQHLRPNPRHVKRLVNSYLFVKALAKQRDDFSIFDDPKLIFMWLAISSQWPEFIDRFFLERDRMSDQQLEFAQEVDSPFHGVLEDERYSDLWSSINEEYADAHLLRQALRDESVHPDWEGIRTLRKYSINLRIPKKPAHRRPQSVSAD